MGRGNRKAKEMLLSLNKEKYALLTLSPLLHPLAIIKLPSSLC
jgi:hypothetical protein